MSVRGWQLVIFDCDGVLVDSEVIAHEVLSDALRELGIEIGVDEAMRLFMGNTSAENVAVIEARLGGPMPAGFFESFREKLYETFRERPVQPVAGIAAMLDALDIPSCVVSNGPLAKMRTTLGVTGLLPRFEDRLFSPELGLRGKPHPDLFLAAAERFGAAPARTAVIEDSPAGVAGARRAGMTVFGYTGAPHTDAAALEAAGAIRLPAMDELVRLLAASPPMAEDH